MTAQASLPDGTAVTLGTVGQTIVFENDTVRVWEIVLEPGSMVSWHQHQHPYLVIALRGSSNRIESVDGGVRHVVEPDGGVVYREAGEVHRLIKEGTTQSRSRLVELIGLPGGEHHGR